MVNNFLNNPTNSYIPAIKSKAKQKYKSEYSMTDFIPKTIQIKENGLKEESMLESGKISTKTLNNCTKNSLKPTK